MCLISRDILKFLAEADQVEGLRPFGFFADLSGTMRGPDRVLWLVYVEDEAGAVGKLHDIVVKRGGLSVKSHGELREKATADGDR